MNGQYIEVSSITYAYKGRDALQNRGYGAYIEKAPKELSSCGCHYCIFIRGCTLERATSILESAKVKMISSGNME